MKVKVITVYTASYSRYREDGLPGKVEVEDDCLYPMMFDTEESAIAGTREHAEKKRLDYITNSAETQSRWAIQLDNKKRFLLSDKCPAIAIPRFCIFLLWIIVKLVNRYILNTETWKIKIAFWNGAGKPPGDWDVDIVVLKVAGKYYALDSYALVGPRIHYSNL